MVGSMRRVLALVLLVRVAHADPSSDAGKAFQTFVDGAAAKKLPADVEAFISPDKQPDPAVAAPDGFAKIAPKPKLAIVATHLAKSGTAAWIVATIGGAKYTANNPVTTPLRASAFLTLDGGAWHVRAAHISGGKPNHESMGGMCGAMEKAYEPGANIAKGAEPAVKVLTDAFKGPVDGKGTSAMVMPALSDDKGAQMFGSAPNEQFTGGAAIKKVFKGWKIDLDAGNDEQTRAGIASGGDLAWVAMEISTFWQCTNYRALFVLQKEGSAWKIVHQHYSEDVETP